MLIELLAYVALGAALTVPTWRLLRLVGQRAGWWSTRLQYLRPYVPEQQNATPPSPATKGPA
jgi:hypothetical protein